MSTRPQARPCRRSRTHAHTPTRKPGKTVTSHASDRSTSSNFRCPAAPHRPPRPARVISPPRALSCARARARPTGAPPLHATATLAGRGRGQARTHTRARARARYQPITAEHPDRVQEPGRAHGHVHRVQLHDASEPTNGVRPAQHRPAAPNLHRGGQGIQYRCIIPGTFAPDARELSSCQVNCGEGVFSGFALRSISARAALAAIARLATRPWLLLLLLALAHAAPSSCSAAPDAARPPSLRSASPRAPGLPPALRASCLVRRRPRRPAVRRRTRRRIRRCGCYRAVSAAATGRGGDLGPGNCARALAFERPRPA